MRVTLLIPTLNEVEGMKQIMPCIRREWVDQILIVDGGSKRSLKSYMSPVDTKFPVSGKPNETVPVDDLNKNTNTQ